MRATPGRWASSRARARAHSSAASTSATVAGSAVHPSAASSTRASASVMPVNAQRPARNAATASSLAAFSTAGTQPPGAPGRTGEAHARERVVVERLEGPALRRVPPARTAPRPAAAPARPARARSAAACPAGWPGRAWRRPTKVTIECTIDCGCTTTSIRSYGHAEQQVGLDQLQPLVDQRGRVERDHRAHVPGRMGQRLVDGDAGQLGAAPSAERAAGRGQHEPVHLVGPPAAQALGQRGVLGVDGHDLPGRGGRRHQRAARRPATPCWPARASAPAASAASVGPEADRAGDAVEHHVGAGGGGQLGGRLRPGEHLDARQRSRSARRRPRRPRRRAARPCARACRRAAPGPGRPRPARRR